jgi:hypothetical protein
LVVETTAEHLQRHDPKVEWQSCARCAYYYKRAVLEKACSFEEEYTREKLCYLIEAPDLGVHEWGIGCVVCRWAGLKTTFAQCKIDSLSLILKKTKLARHADSVEHQKALTKWQTARDPSKAEQKISHGEDEIDAAVDEDPTTGIGYGHVVALLTEVKRAGSAYDWERSMDVLRRCGAALPHGFDGRTVFHQLCMVCAGFEKALTKCLLQEAALVALQQDGRDPWLLILSRMVLWRLPRSDHKEGCLRAVKSVLPDGAPPPPGPLTAS